MGNNAMRAVGINGKISSNRGSVWEIQGIPTVPVLHPAALLPYRLRGSVSALAVWDADIAKAKEISLKGWKPPEEHFITEPTLYHLSDIYATWRDTLVAVDIETTSLDVQYSELVVVGLAISGHRAFSVPFLTKGGNPYWSTEDSEWAGFYLQEIFLHNDLLFQNSLFDVMHLRRHGFDIPWANISHDTMLAHHCLSPELPHNLGFIVSVYGDTPYWKEGMLSSHHPILERDDGEVREYNLRDAVVLHQVLQPLLEDLREAGGQRLYQEEALPLVKPIIKMMENGILLHQNRLTYWKRRLKKSLKEKESELRELAALPDAFNLDSPVDLRLLLYGVRPKKFDKIPQLEKKRAGTKVYVELSGIRDVSRVRPIFLPPGHQGTKTDTGLMATDKKGLLSLQVATQNRLATLETLKRPTESHTKESEDATRLLRWIALFQAYRKLSKTVSTYTSFPTGPDSRVHTSFLIHGTKTGRLSSSNPALQNITKEEVAIRRCFIPAPNCLFLSGDYDNFEGRILAYETSDEVLTKAFEAGADVHDINTKLLFNIDKRHTNWKQARAAAKIFFFGGLAYGGGDRTIYEQVILAAPDLALTFNAFVNAKRRWLRAHPAYTVWRQKLENRIRATRKVSNAFGRSRELLGTPYDIVKEGINHPIQSTAASIVNRAMIRIDNEMEKKGLASKMILQVHDQILFEVPKEELKVMKELVKRQMEKPINYRGTMRSFPVDLETGPSWGELK
jgi:DNA polymerase I-like protein with 3'-5' exonuclease and polymerase domains